MNPEQIPHDDIAQLSAHQIPAPRDPAEAVAFFSEHYRDTAPRFSLVRGDNPLSNPNVADIVSPTFTVQDEFGGEVAVRQRWLVVEKQPAQQDIYDKLAGAGVPQLTQLAVASQQYNIFAVPEGAKILAKEALHDLPSSRIYKGDGDTFADAGELYGRAWRATEGLLLVASGDEAYDTPLDHIAVQEEVDEHSPSQRLCPPYDEYLRVSDPAEAVRNFEQAMLRHAEGAQPYPQHLVARAVAAFRGTVGM